MGVKEGEGYSAFQGSFIPASPHLGVKGVWTWGVSAELPGWPELGGQKQDLTVSSHCSQCQRRPLEPETERSMASERSDSIGKANSESQSLPIALWAPSCALGRKTRAKCKCKLEASPPGSSGRMQMRRHHLLPGHLEQGLSHLGGGLNPGRGLDSPSTRGRL